MVTLVALTLVLALVILSVLARIRKKAQGSLGQQSRSSAPIGPAWLGRLIPTDPTQALVLGAPPRYTVRTVIEIEAAPATVWAHLAEFEPIAEPLDSWLFRAGVAYPVSATLAGQGVGAARVCEFSTGQFVETIRKWEEGRELIFTVDEAPPVLTEWTPYESAHPPHLHGYFLPESADFRLVPLGGSRTRLEGTSVYRNRMWPSSYWRLWSDAIVRRVHRRVFEHVKRLAELDMAR